jgi:hypothetical protein
VRKMSMPCAASRPPMPASVRKSCALREIVITVPRNNVALTLQYVEALCSHGDSATLPHLGVGFRSVVFRPSLSVGFPYLML